MAVGAWYRHSASSAPPAGRSWRRQNAEPRDLSARHDQACPGAQHAATPGAQSIHQRQLGALSVARDGLEDPDTVARPVALVTAAPQMGQSTSRMRRNRRRTGHRPEA